MYNVNKFLLVFKLTIMGNSGQGNDEPIGKFLFKILIIFRRAIWDGSYRYFGWSTKQVCQIVSLIDSFLRQY